MCSRATIFAWGTTAHSPRTAAPGGSFPSGSYWGVRCWCTIRSTGRDGFADSVSATRSASGDASTRGASRFPRTGRVMLSGEITIRVRYAETDRMGLLHHANYLVYFEQGRIELLRSQGGSYKDLEDQGFLMVLTKIEVRYRRPVHYDDLLTLRTI